MVRRIISSICLLLVVTVLTGQVADVTQGCIPLTVSFGTDAMASYYWNFDDGASSTQQSPQHIFTSAGSYNVELFDEFGGTLVGSITVDVFADPVITMTYTQDDNCVPSQVLFTPDIELDDRVNIIGYQWVYGDGNTSNTVSPFYTYTDAGSFTVSLSIETDLPECDFIQIFPDPVEVFGSSASFVFQSPDLCTLPADVVFSYIGNDIAGNTYSWDFGNGDTSNSIGPVVSTYTEPGTYPVTLTVTTLTGCISSFTANVITGAAAFDFDPFDNMCIELDTVIHTNIDCVEYEWTLPPSFTPNEDFHLDDVNEPPYSGSLYGFFNEVGTSVFSYMCVTEGGCELDTTFSVEVIQPNADFIINPAFGCADPLPLEFVPTNPNYPTYIIHGDTLNSPGVFTTFACPPVDSFTANSVVPLLYSLEVIDQFGCKNLSLASFAHQKTEACMGVFPNNGCVPLEVSFTNMTETLFQLTDSQWDLGDGTIVNTTGRDSLKHIYTEPGDYYAKLIANNTEGCQDTSVGVWIQVGDESSADVSIQAEGICTLNDLEITIENESENLDHWSFGGLINDHCPEILQTQGLTVVSNVMTLEDNGCFTEVPIDFNLRVVGTSLPGIAYSIDCIAPFVVQLEQVNPLQDGETIEWFIDGISVSTSTAFAYEFDGPGVYVASVTVYNDTCPSNTVASLITITDVRAILEVPETVCIGSQFVLDGSGSTGVFEESLNPYTFITDIGERPQAIDDNFLAVFADSIGTFTASLRVVDPNGCLHDTTAIYTVTNIEAGFSLPLDSICTGGTYPFTNLSISDTTITDYEWIDLSDEQNPIFTFEEIEPFIDPSDHLTIVLAIEDANGCADTLQQRYNVFEMDVNIDLIGLQGVCAGEELTFTAETSLQDSTYSLLWDFGDGQTSEMSPQTITLDSTGLFMVNLSIAHNLFGCESEAMTVPLEVVEIPIAAFTSTLDSLDILCHPAIVDFVDMSTYSGLVSIDWDMSGAPVINNPNPSFTFEKGDHEVQLVVSSPYGCADSTSIAFTLIGPEGLLMVDDDTLCLGDEFEASVFDLVDVNSIVWDLGDGTLVEDLELVTHDYEVAGTAQNTIVKAILRSDVNGCETILEHPIVLGSVPVSIDFVIDQGLCATEVNFSSIDMIAETFNWDFGEGSSGNGNPVMHTYGSEGQFEVTLEAIDSLTQCRATTSEIISIDEPGVGFFVPNIFTPNGDSTNDFFNYVYTEGDQSDVTIIAFKVYNRWGNLIYDNETPATGWDGTIDAKLSPSEVYAYYIELDILDCGIKSQKGNVTVIR